MTLEEARRRDRILRSYAEMRDWDNDRERGLVRALVCNSRRLLPAYPLLVGLEWETPDGSRGDLLFQDEAGNYAVVEVKALGNSPTRARGKVEEQARRYAREAAEMFEARSVVALVYTCDQHKDGRPPRDADARRGRRSN